MDEEADASYDQQHYQRKLIEVEGEIRGEIAGAKPRGDSLDVGKREGSELRRDPQRHEKCRAAKGQRNRGHRLAREALAKEAVNGGANEKQNRNQPEGQVRRHSLRRFTCSVVKV